jgi:hypothetical protein
MTPFLRGADAKKTASDYGSASARRS